MYLYELSPNMQDLIANFCEAKDSEESFLDSFDSAYEHEIAKLPLRQTLEVQVLEMQTLQVLAEQS